jgi:hypothetical protein
MPTDRLHKVYIGYGPLREVKDMNARIDPFERVATPVQTETVRRRMRLYIAAAIALASIFTLFAATSHADAAGCFAKPSSCGYPDATNTGVPAGTSLTPSGSKTVTTNGTVLNGLEITGTVTVAADNVTIKNSKVIRTSGGSGTYGVILNNGADNFTIEHSEVYGPTSETAGLQSAVWNHYGNPGVVARYDYFHHCADCWEGPGVFENDFMVVNAAYTGSHDEDIYVCGAAVDVEHSTLFNTHHQTATVFGDTASCGGNTFEIHNSLLAGGGYMLYPQGNASSSTGVMNITNNRFARCVSGTVYDSSTGGTYCNSKTGDTAGYYPYGGFYGLAAYYFTGGANVWTGNVWDDSSKPVCPSGSEGCGSTTPPPTGPPAEEPTTEPPAEEPPAEEPPIEEPTTEPPVEEPTTEPPAEEPPVEKPASDPLEAILNVPSKVLSDAPTVLDGTESTGPGSLTCRWTISTGKESDSVSGCLVVYSFENPGNSSIKLTVHSSAGGSDSSRQSVTVLPAESKGSDGGSPETPPTSTPPPGTGTGTGSGPGTGSGSSPGSRSGGWTGGMTTGPGSTIAEAAAYAAAARAAWEAPARVRPGTRIPLVAAVDATTTRCTWRISDKSAGLTTITRHGCSTSLQAPAGGTLSIRLTIEGSDGSVSSVRRTIGVGPAGVVAVARRA